jgi:S1-C subfamily serine protease
MFFTRFPLALCVLIFAVGAARAQEAQAILDATAKVYTGLQSYSVEVETRALTLAVGTGQEASEAPRFSVQSTSLKRMKLKVRRPNEYWVAVQSSNIREGSGSRVSAPWSFFARSSETQAKQGFYAGSGGRFTVKDIDVQQFQSMVRMHFSQMPGSYSSSRGEDMVLRHFPVQGTMSEGNMSLGLVEPDLIGRETRNGRTLYRLAAKTTNGEAVMLWIEEDTSLVVRTIVHSNRPRGAMVVETLYNNQRTKAVFVSADFSIVAPPSNEVPTEGIMGFGSVGELVKMIDLKPTGQPGAAGLAEVPNKPEEPPAAPVSPADGQALSYEQMSGIVLIEGDGGTATGFMTKIRDVDFVVTNLHVLGGNKKISLKTLRGEEVPVLGIFGAAGSDIAIIRIAKGQGELKLAEDVLKTSKIGDKVVVVGNRQGGGVATQTQGSIVGVGPTRIEVNANFEPGNSGSPIVNLTTGEVVGVASYSETRRLEVEETGGSAARAARRSEAPKVEKRWFGYRLDSIAKWEAVDLTKWNAQEGRIETFRDLSEALVAVLRLDFNTARRHPRLSSLITSFEARMQASGGTGVNAATEVKDLFRVIRSISDDGVRDLTNGDYYDYFRTSLYWETSIPAQLEYRKSIIEVLKKYEANSAGYLSRMRGGN